MRYLLDTDAFSDIVKKHPVTSMRFAELDSLEAGISTVTLKEIEYGLRLNPQRSLRIHPMLATVLDSIRIISFDPEDALSTGNIRAYLKRRGTPIGPYDLMIAGTALARDLILVTANTREFSRVPRLRLEDWRIPGYQVRELPVGYGTINMGQIRVQPSTHAA